MTLTDSIREAMLLLGGNGIVEDFTVLPRLLRDAMIIETWEGAHNTLCLQIVRDAAKSSLLDRWRAEIEAVLSEWPRELLSQTRARFEPFFRQTLDEITKARLADHQWSATHARRVVDRLGSILEIAWMARIADEHSKNDATAALLTATSAHFLLPGPSALDGAGFFSTSQHWAALIEEAPISADVANF